MLLAHGVTLGNSAGQEVGLNDPCRCLPTQLILSLYQMQHQQEVEKDFPDGTIEVGKPARKVFESTGPN